jgi:hypothetical protein
MYLFNFYGIILYYIHGVKVIVDELLRRLENNETQFPIPTLPRLTGLVTYDNMT